MPFSPPTTRMVDNYDLQVRNATVKIRLYTRVLTPRKYIAYIYIYIYNVVIISRKKIIIFETTKRVYIKYTRCTSQTTFYNSYVYYDIRRSRVISFIRSVSFIIIIIIIFPTKIKISKQRVSTTTTTTNYRRPIPSQTSTTTTRLYKCFENARARAHTKKDFSMFAQHARAHALISHAAAATKNIQNNILRAAFERFLKTIYDRVTAKRYVL